MEYTASPQPLFDWFEQDKSNRAILRSHGYSDGRITNWKRRGIPLREIGRVAPLMGLTYEQYMETAENHERKSSWRRAAALTALALMPLFVAPQVEAATLHSHNYPSFFQNTHWRRWWLSFCIFRLSSVS